MGYFSGKNLLSAETVWNRRIKFITYTLLLHNVITWIFLSHALFWVPTLESSQHHHSSALIPRTAWSSHLAIFTIPTLLDHPKPVIRTFSSYPSTSFRNHFPSPQTMSPRWVPTFGPLFIVYFETCVITPHHHTLRFGVRFPPWGPPNRIITDLRGLTARPHSWIAYLGPPDRIISD